jgi:5-bromo-4-chloroindolyl phosphate hydrolysis protein
MTFQDESLHRIEMHEKECSIRYEYIEKSLNEGREKFKKIEMMLWGLYGMLAASFGLIKLF